MHRCQSCLKSNISTQSVMLHPLGCLRPSVQEGRIQFAQNEIDRIYVYKDKDPELAKGVAQINYGKDMKEMPDKLEEGWYEWLTERGLDDPSLNQQQLYLRYQRFSKVKFGLIPPEEQYKYLRDLLEFEDGLVFGDAIGHVPEFPFDFKVIDKTPIRQKPIAYAAHEREWINNYLKKQVDLGILQQIKPGAPEPVFCVGVVLVKEGQSQQAYRLCANLVQPNTRIDLSALPLVDVSSVMDQLEGAKVFSALDIKAGFFNIPVAEGIDIYLGLVTQDGLYKFLKMPFGHALAPCHFQAVMSWALSRAKRPLKAGIYLDDTTIKGNDIYTTWLDTIEGMKSLLRVGLPINIWKCQFLCSNVQVLGYTLCENRYQLGAKAMKKLFSTRLPTTLVELQRLMGKLNFSSKFVADYKRLAAPLYNLMSAKAGGRWRIEHTEALNLIVELVSQRLQLSLVDTKKPLDLNVDTDGEYISVVMTQNNDDNICAIAGRPLTKTERTLPTIEQMLVAAIWGYKRYAKYCLYVPQVSVVLKNPAELAYVASNPLSVRIQAMLIELSSLLVQFKCGSGAWEIQNELARTVNQPPISEKEPIIPPIWEHQDIDIPMEQGADAAIEAQPAKYSIYFDGACRKKQAAGGYVVMQCDKVISGQFKKYEVDVQTNNKAEITALYDALMFVRNNYEIKRGEKLNVFGDSQLIINFVNRKYSPKDKYFSRYIDLIRKIVRSIHGTVKFYHVPRAQNTFADFLSQVGVTTLQSGELEDVPQLLQKTQSKFKVPLGLIPALEEENKTYMHVEVNPPPIIKCKRCKLTTDIDRMIECGLCDRFYHKGCLPAQLIPQRRGPWHCKRCRERLNQSMLFDIMTDEELLQFLSHRACIKGPIIYKRVLKASQYINMDQAGKIWITGPKAGPPRLVPQLKQRSRIVSQLLKDMAYPSGDVLFQVLRNSYYWPNMLLDCQEMAIAALPRQKERARFKSPPYLMPTDKGCKPFQVWCIDTIVKMSPASPSGATSIIVAVCAFSKWVELGPLDEVSRDCTAKWFHDNIICRFGCPSIVRTDQGVEYRGTFHSYLQMLGVRHRPVATMNPRANGQVERFNQTIEAGIRRLTEACPGSSWWEFLGDVGRALRLIPKKATGYSPYILVYKQSPVLPLPSALGPYEEKELENMTNHQIIELTETFKLLAEEVVLRQNQYDKKMVEQYRKRTDLAREDVRFIFSEGDSVLLRQRDPRKMKTKAMGPYTFIKYEGRRGTTAIILNVKGQERQVSTNNLIPVHPPAQRLLRFNPGEIPPPFTLNSDDSTISISDSEDDQAMPPGVRLVPTPPGAG